MKFLLLFLDGVGLGPDDPEINPLARAHMPVLRDLLNGSGLVQETLENGFSRSDTNPLKISKESVSPFSSNGRMENGRATLLALDARLGIDGHPQSATGQASLLTGINVPELLGYHQGPRPNRQVSEMVKKTSLFLTLKEQGYRVGLVNAYPPQYFEAIQSGKRSHGTIPEAILGAGLPLRTHRDLEAGRALAADFTGRGWKEKLGYAAFNTISPETAGKRLAQTLREDDLVVFDHWLSDLAGHRRNMSMACDLLEDLDRVLKGFLDEWSEDEGLILITSDHGNMEDLSTRLHTDNPVPALIIGAPEYRHHFTDQLRDLSDITPAILSLFETFGTHARA